LALKVDGFGSVTFPAVACCFSYDGKSANSFSNGDGSVLVDFFDDDDANKVDVDFSDFGEEIEKRPRPAPAV